MTTLSARRQALERERSAGLSLAHRPHPRHTALAELFYKLVATAQQIRSRGAVFGTSQAAIHVQA
jgi:hypothetical protein